MRAPPIASLLSSLAAQRKRTLTIRAIKTLSSLQPTVHVCVYVCGCVCICVDVYVDVCVYVCVCVISRAMLTKQKTSPSFTLRRHK